MNIARIARAAAVIAAGALATAGAARAAPLLAPGADTADTEKSAATPVYYYNGYYQTGPYGTYYQPYYAPYGYAPPPRYYAPYPYGYRYGYSYYGYRPRPHGGLFIRTPGLRLGIGW